MKDQRIERGKAAFSTLVIFSFLVLPHSLLACDFNEISANPAKAAIDVAAATSGKTVCFGAGKYRMAKVRLPRDIHARLRQYKHHRQQYHY